MNNILEMQVVRFTPALREDFFRLHNPQNECGWCYCVAWWVPTWDGWSERGADQNRELRSALLDAGEYDGYLAYAGGMPAGWCQVGRRDRFEKLVRQFRLSPDPKTWAITCFLIAPAYRSQGLAARMLAAVLADLRNQGIQRVEAYPKRGVDLDVDDLWNGPESMFRAAGFGVVKDHPTRPVLSVDLHPGIL